MKELNVKKLLASNEHIVFREKQQTNLYLSSSDFAGIILFLIFGIGSLISSILFAVYMPPDTVNNLADIFIYAALSLVFALSFHIAFSRIIYRAILVPRTEYILTNKNVIRVMGNRVDMVGLKQIKKNTVQILMNEDGTGNVIFNIDTSCNPEKRRLAGEISFRKNQFRSDLKGHHFSYAECKAHYPANYLNYAGVDKDFCAIENIKQPRSWMSKIKKSK